MNDAEKRYHFATIPNRTFTGLEAIAWMYCLWKAIDPTLDVGADFSREYGLAKRLLDSLYDQRNFVEAREEFRAAVSLRPDDAEAHFLFGVDLFRNRDRDAAIAELRKATHLKPEWHLAHYRLGRMLGANGDSESASYEFSDLWKLGPNYPVILEEDEKILRRIRR